MQIKNHCQDSQFTYVKRHVLVQDVKEFINKIILLSWKNNNNAKYEDERLLFEFLHSRMRPTLAHVAVDI